MPIKYVFLPFKGTFEFALVKAAGAVALTTARLSEASDYRLTEGGDNLVQEGG